MRLRPLFGAVLATALWAAACGPSVILEPLVGEDPELFEGLRTTTPDVRQYGPARRLLALHAALLRGEPDRAWDYLSNATRAALDEQAGGQAVSGRALLASDRILVRSESEPNAEARPVTALQWLLVDDLQSVRLTLVPGDKPVQKDGRAILYVVDGHANFRQVQLTLEEGEWRLEQSRFVVPMVPLS